MPNVEDATRVTVEITARGYTTTLWAGDEKIAEQSWKLKSRGNATAVEGRGDWRETLDPNDDDDCAAEDLGDELDDIDHAAFSIAGTLWSFAEDYRCEEMNEVSP